MTGLNTSIFELHPRPLDVLVPSRKSPPFRLRLYIVLTLTLTLCGLSVGAQENVDHAGIISAWDEQSVARGQKLYQLACAPCHGTDGLHTINPQSRRFAADVFKTGSDPYSLYKTISHGYKNMPSQSWMTPEQRYDVIDFIRETFLRKLNPSQFTRIDPAYLDSLPKFNP